MRVYSPLTRQAPTKSNPFKLFFAIMALIGTLFTLSGVGLVFWSIDIRQNYTPATATITGFVSSGDSTSTQLEFMADGTSYRTSSNSYSSGWRVGSRLEIYYDPANPMQVQVRSMLNLLPTIFLGIGSCMVVGGAIGLWRIAAGKRSRAALIENGQRLYGTVVGYEQNTHLSMNGRYPFLLHVEYEGLDGTKRCFTSNNLWQDVDDRVLDRQIVVYLDRENSSRYYVDADALF